MANFNPAMRGRGEGGGRGTGKMKIGRWVHKLCRSPALFKRSRASYSAPTSAKSWNVNLFSAEVYFLLPWPSGLVIRKLGRGSNGSAPRPRGDCLEGEREELSFFPSFHARLPNSILLWSLHGSEWVWPFLCWRRFFIKKRKQKQKTNKQLLALQYMNKSAGS